VELILTVVREDFQVEVEAAVAERLGTGCSWFAGQLDEWQGRDEPVRTR